MFRNISLASAIVFSFVTLGCGGDGLDRHDLYGKVTYQGKPVPYGSISFRPDYSKGGSGPTGFAKVEDGEYNTGNTGKGAIAGPVQVFIEGAVSKEQTPAALFPIFKTTIEVTGEVDQFDFEVPVDASSRGSNNGKGKIRNRAASR